MHKWGAEERRVPGKDMGRLQGSRGEGRDFFLLSVIIAGRGAAGQEGFRAVQLF